MHPFQEFERCSTDILISRLGINTLILWSLERLIRAFRGYFSSAARSGSRGSRGGKGNVHTRERRGRGKIGILKFWVARCKKKPQRAANGCGTLVTQFRRGHKRVFGDIEPWDATYLQTDRPTNQPTDRSCLTFSLLLPSFSFFQPPVFSCPFHSALLRPYLRLSCIFAYPRIVRIASWIGIRKSTPIPYNNKTKKKRKQIPNYPSETFLFCKNLWSVADRLWPKIKIII